mgnify:CR=1 FL=1
MNFRGQCYGGRAEFLSSGFLLSGLKSLAATLLLLAGIFGMLTANGRDASAQSAPRVEAIQVEGNQRVEADAVRSYMTLAVGDPITNDGVNRSLKTLFATGLFADVNMRLQGRTVVVSIVENPIINRMAFEGNKRIKDELGVALAWPTYREGIRGLLSCASAC